MKKIIYSMGGKGGVGKTTAMVSLVEWFRDQNLICSVLDFDTENKTQGSLAHFFPDLVQKVNISGRDGLDVLIDHLDKSEVIIADMGASSGDVASHWFDSVYADLKTEVEFIAVGVVTPDPASLASVLQWGANLQDRVKYLIILNAGEDETASFELWESRRAKAFQEAFHPEVITMESRNPKLQNLMRDHGITVGQVASKQATQVPELSKLSSVIRAQGYRRRMNSELDRIRNFMLSGDSTSGLVTAKNPVEELATEVR
jgi:hypothetical protein